MVKTLHEYVQHHRVAFAETLLRDTSDSLAEVALWVGYKTQSAFTMDSV
ncbi:MAG: helix-turn-helix transcriptional regulator [Bacteroidetes Order II. Incertae sedis bacterium]|nr:helix-turn-helix transcriptional regulator [Bacteroidetes Order II. bacterium]